jgi:ABC-type dipeptide/oligopeptide/nickel transport system permease subunit
MEQTPALRPGGSWRSGWRRLRRDRGGFVSLIVVVLLLLLALFGSAVASRLVGPIGRDELIRLLDGLRTSLEIAIGAIIVALAIAAPVGAA